MPRTQQDYHQSKLWPRSGIISFVVEGVAVDIYPKVFLGFTTKTAGLIKSKYALNL